MKALGELKHKKYIKCQLHKSEDSSLLPSVRRLVQKDVRKHLLNDDYVLEVSKGSQDCRS